MSVHNTHRCVPGSSMGETALTVEWRRRQLGAAGFPDELAARLAGTPGIDLHVLLNLVDRGCPPDLAVRIVDTPLLGDEAAIR